MAPMGQRHLQPVDDMPLGDVLAFTSFTMRGTVTGHRTAMARYSLDRRCRAINEVIRTYGRSLFL
jgi:hypothetical protein